MNLPSAFPRTASWNEDMFGGPEPTVGSELLYRAARIAGLVRGGQGMHPEMVAEALAALNTLIDHWRTERLTVPYLDRGLYDLVPNQRDYTLGPGGNWDAPLPIRIEHAGLVRTNVTPNPEIALIVMSAQDWASWASKDLTNPQPYAIYYQASFPLTVVSVVPVPTLNHKIALYTWKTLAEFSSEKDTFILPPGFRAALQYNLAVELALMYPERARLHAIAERKAREYMANVKSFNEPLLTMRSERAARGFAGRGYYDIWTNTYT